MWRNTVEPGSIQMTSRRMCIACQITKAADTRSEHVIPIAFPLQQWLRERASILRYTYVARPVLQIPFAAVWKLKALATRGVFEKANL